LVTYYQKLLNTTTLLLTISYLTIAIWALFSPNVLESWIAYSQILATVLNTSALLPQLKQNFDLQSSGDYSAVTVSLASAGCVARIFTTMELADGDLLILLNYGVALLLNTSLLLQIVYFGMTKEGKSLTQVFLADVKTTEVRSRAQ
jgi:mannose-P-dolichol utilization defect protein 1